MLRRWISNIDNVEVRLVEEERCGERNLSPVGRIILPLTRIRDTREKYLHFTLCTKHYALCTMHYALCTMHYETLVRSCMIWKTAAISPRFQHPLNSATPLCERDRPSFSSSHTYKESLCPISLFGAIQKIFSPTLSSSSSHTYKAHF